MTYLVEIKSFEDLKAKYREWALKLHPDMGGIRCRDAGAQQ